MYIIHSLRLIQTDDMYMKLNIGPTFEDETCVRHEPQSFIETNSSTWLYSCRKREPFFLILKICCFTFVLSSHFILIHLNILSDERKKEMPYT
jgi:hypothetical protein